MNSLFSKEKVNTGRQHEFDIVKTMCIIFMIGIHILENVLSSLCTTTANFFLIDLNLYFTATVFMFMMGVGTVYSRRSSARNLAYRGLMLLTFGWVLNFFRFFVPDLITYGITKDSFDLNHLPMFFSVDIMQFSGLAFLTLSLFKKLRLSSFKIFLIAVGMSILGTVLEYCQTGFYPVDQLLGFFWGTYSECYFPLLNWFIIVAGGILYGELYIHLKEKKKWHMALLPAGIVVSAAYIWGSGLPQQHIFHIISDFTGFTWIRLPDAIGCIVIAMTLTGLIAVISRGKEISFCSRVSADINKYYCVSWVLICVICRGRYGGIFSLPENDAAFLIMLLFVFFLSMLFILLYEKYLESSMMEFFGRHRTFWILSVWIISVCITIASFMIATEYPNMFNGYLLDLRS